MPIEYSIKWPGNIVLLFRVAFIWLSVDTFSHAINSKKVDALSIVYETIIVDHYNSSFFFLTGKIFFSNYKNKQSRFVWILFIISFVQTKVQVVPVDLRPKHPLVYRVSWVNF